MSRIRSLLILAAWLLASIQSLPAQSLTEVRSTLKTLHKIQDDLARGDTSVVVFQSELVARLKAGLFGVPDLETSTNGYLETVFEFALSGGETKAVQELLGRSVPANEQVHLYKAVKFYNNGDMQASAKSFDDAKLEEADLRLRPYLELAKGTANLGIDMHKAKSSFETVILLAPGTLLEEVALRRLVAVGVELKDAVLFSRCAHLYLRRYSESPFFREFVKIFVTGTGDLEKAAEIEALADKVARLSEEKRRPVFKAIISMLVTKGRLEAAAIFMLEATKEMPGPADHYSQFLALHQAMIELGASPGLKHLAFFSSLDGSKLALEDAELLEIAKHVAWNILRPVSASASSAAFIGPVRGNTMIEKPGSKVIQQDDVSQADDILRSGKAQLEEIDKILGQTR